MAMTMAAGIACHRLSSCRTTTPPFGSLVSSHAHAGGPVMSAPTRHPALPRFRRA
jgi:hypothetical protein